MSNIKRRLENGETTTSTKVVDSNCAYNDHGITCGRRGIFSSSTLGTGSWYCRSHAWVILHDRGDEPRVLVDDVQAAAAAYCRERGLNTVDEMRNFVKGQLQGIREKTVMREPGED